MRQFPGRSGIAVTLTLVVASFATGLRHEHAADHDGGESHVERAHGGHQHLVPVGDPQVRPERASLPPAVVAAAPVVTVDRGAYTEYPPTAPVWEPYGPDPPHQLGARAPPVLLA